VPEFHPGPASIQLSENNRYATTTVTSWVGVAAKPINTQGMSTYTWAVQIVKVGNYNFGMIGAIPQGEVPGTSHFSNQGGGIYQPSFGTVYAQWPWEQITTCAIDEGAVIKCVWKIDARTLLVYAGETYIATFKQLPPAIVPCIHFFGAGSAARFIPVPKKK